MTKDTRPVLIESALVCHPTLTDKPAPKDVLIKFQEHCGRCDGTEHKGHCHPPLLERINAQQTYLYLRGPAQRLDYVNDNKRKYPRSVFEQHLREGSEFMRRLRNREVLGELEHPDSGNTTYPRVSHIVVDAVIEDLDSNNPYKVEPGAYVITEEMVLPTPYGQIIEVLARAGSPIGFSSRGRGDVQKENDIDIVESNYDVDTWDAVARPSVRQARQYPKESKMESRKKLNEQDEMPGAGPAAPPPPPPMDASGGGAPPLPTGTGAEAPNILAQNTDLLKQMEEIIATGDDIKDYTDIMTKAIDALNQLMNAEDPETTKVRDQLLGYMKILLMKAADQMGKHGSHKSKSSSSSSEKKSEEPKKDEKKEKEKKEALDMIQKAKAVLAEISNIHEDEYDDLVDMISEKRTKDKGTVYRGEIENFLHRSGHKPDDTSVESLASAMRRKGFDVRHKQYGETQKESAGERSNPTMPQTDATPLDLNIALADRCTRLKARVEELEAGGSGVPPERYEAAATLCAELTDRNTELTAENEELVQFNEAAVRMLHGMRSIVGKLAPQKNESKKEEAPKKKTEDTKPAVKAEDKMDTRPVAEVVTERRGVLREDLNEDSLTPESVEKLKASAKTESQTSPSPEQLLISKPNARMNTVGVGTPTKKL